MFFKILFIQKLLIGFCFFLGFQWFLTIVDCLSSENRVTSSSCFAFCACSSVTLWCTVEHLADGYHSHCKTNSDDLL